MATKDPPMKSIYSIVGIIIAVSFCLPLYAIDNPHFYRATYFWGEPRFEQSWLSSLDVSFGGASTKIGRNNHGKKVPLLDIYGLSDMQFLGRGVPTDPTNFLDQILINLMQLPTNDNFGKFSTSSSFHGIEIVFNGYQNLVNGFFLQAYLPIRALKIDTPRFIDVSPEQGTPNKNTPEWQTFLRFFPQILERYNIMPFARQQNGAGDLSLLCGWARNYEETTFLDFIDVDAKIGILFPTGKKQNVDFIFDLPLGYNGHFGVPLKFDCSIGMWEWLTLGCHLGALFFFNADQYVRIKTGDQQQGFIKLVKTKASVDEGTIWDASLYVKADHVIKGVSLLCGYSFNKKEHDIISPRNGNFDAILLNRDEMFKNWHMHCIHFMAEYDLATYYADNLPRIGFFYTMIVGGKRIFNANVNDLYVGIDIAWRC